MKIVAQIVGLLLVVAAAQAVIAILWVALLALFVWGALFRPRETALLFAYTAVTALIVTQPFAFLAVMALAVIVSALNGARRYKHAEREIRPKPLKQLPHETPD